MVSLEGIFGQMRRKGFMKRKRRKMSKKRLERKINRENIQKVAFDPKKIQELRKKYRK